MLEDSPGDFGALPDGSTARGERFPRRRNAIDSPCRGFGPRLKMDGKRGHQAPYRREITPFIGDEMPRRGLSLTGASTEGNIQALRQPPLSIPYTISLCESLTIETSVEGAVPGDPFVLSGSDNPLERAIEAALGVELTLP